MATPWNENATDQDYLSAARERCPNGLLPDGPECPLCGGEREVTKVHASRATWWSHRASKGESA